MASTFGAFQTELCEYLTIEACRKLCVYFQFEPVRTESILMHKPQGITLLGELVEQTIIDAGNLRKLLDALKHLKMNAAARLVEDYENARDMSETSSLPDDLNSDEEENLKAEPSYNTSFEEFKKKIGLKDTLTLKKMLEIKRPNRDAPVTELFWEKITSLDCRITSLQMTQTYKFNVRDLIFAILHCSDNCLRQDIMTKMSSCQLAIPLVLNGLNKGKPKFMFWAMRNVRKKIKAIADKHHIERPMYKHKTFTVSFIRIGDIRVSKSDLLNSLLSECQGNQQHSFFIGKKLDETKPTFSDGSIEVVWFIPGADDKTSLKNPTAVLNLRGDSKKFKTQAEFLYKVSNLIFVLMGKQNWTAHKVTIEKIKKMAAEVQVVAIRESDDIKSEEHLDLKYDSVIIVRKMHMMALNKEICRRICESQKSNINLWSLENYFSNVRDVGVDISSEYLATIESIVRKIVPKKINIKEFKNEILRLFPAWVKLVQLDETTHTTEFGTGPQHASIEEQKMIKRQPQNDLDISDEVKGFWELLRLVETNTELFNDCLMYLRTLLFDLTHKGTSESTKKIQDEMESGRDSHETFVNETRAQWESCIGIEDFMRELGQLYEARTQPFNFQKNAIDVMRLPELAAQFIEKGNSLEILDDKSYCVQVDWISNILEELSESSLDQNAKVLVVSVIGVQGSGKSTLLNSMFGTSFPVSAGMCTRGLFLRLLKIEEEYATDIGCNYIIVIDTEGLKADYGGLDDISTTRLNNKMVTLAMCISDLTIVNIANEYIGSDVTNFLQIAAYASIRMKEVDVQSQCRIIQQRVSDVTATDKNRTNMLKIISVLDEAVRKAAEEQGLVDRCKKFSDVFKLSIDDHAQYVCSLWSGNMNPPNHLYASAVTKFKEHILENISEGQLEVNYTFKEFRSRLRAVYMALKEENFVFKFEDVTRAIAYNDFSLQCNKWLCNVRAEVLETWLSWQQQMRTVEDHERENMCKDFNDRLAEDMCKHSKTVNELFQSYVQNCQNAKYSFEECFSLWIKASLAKTEYDIQVKISNEAKALQFAKRDISSFVANTAMQIRRDAKKNATECRENNSEQIDKAGLQNYFDQYWEKSINSILRRYNLEKVSKEGIIEECKKILIKLCNGNAIENDILTLLQKEGNILTHRQDFNTIDYIPNKTDMETVDADIAEVKSSTLEHFKIYSFQTAFDPYLVCTTLQKGLSDLTYKEGKRSLRFPSVLIAKVLLHLCGLISELAANNDVIYHKENSCHDLFEKYKEDIKLDFNAFYNDEYQNDRAYECICKLISQQLRIFILHSLRSRIIKYFCEEVVRTKRQMHILVLEYVCQENRQSLYLDYIHNNVDFLINWMKTVMARKLETIEKGMTWIEFQYKSIVALIKLVSDSTVQKLSEATSLPEWCEKFTESLKEQKIRLDLKEASIYHVSNLAQFSTNIGRFCQSDLFEQVKQSLQLNDVNEPNKPIERFLEVELNRPYEDVVKSFLGCQAQCPFCKAPCSDENTECQKHTAFCHYPRGLAGHKWPSNKLVEQSCELSVASDEVCYEKDGASFLYKDYQKNYPSWKIPTSRNDEYYYWASAFAKINEYCSEYYSCEPADLPGRWSAENTILRVRMFLVGDCYVRKSKLLLTTILEKILLKNKGKDTA